MFSRCNPKEARNALGHKYPTGLNKGIVSRHSYFWSYVIPPDSRVANALVSSFGMFWIPVRNLNWWRRHWIFISFICTEKKRSTLFQPMYRLISSEYVCFYNLHTVYVYSSYGGQRLRVCISILITKHYVFRLQADFSFWGLSENTHVISCILLIRKKMLVKARNERVV